ncbi:class I SAM-dependent methyltransferase [uncultured Jatrophihabitans sp.]|uniref:class I SAM-dependent methyltransferase n=1 Tax=uncultured Jatrophihabitans sp. TaxID=1610747 RepID=UPI0035C9DFD7
MSSGDGSVGQAVGVGRRPADSPTSVRASRAWWDTDADGYQAEHGRFLGEADFVWCPENLREQDAHLLGDVRGRRILEVGCGAAMCSRWLVGQGAHPFAFDLSGGMLRHARTGNADTGLDVPLVQADAEHIPFRDASFDLAFTAFGAIQFVADSARLMREVARVLRPGGRWVFATTHPTRWAFPDDPGPGGLVATMPYSDRTPYVEYDEDGMPTYVEHHRTLGDRVREITAAGLQLVDVVEPEWPAGHTQVWGQWSPLRGAILPGTAIYVCVLPAKGE